jgi:hypothetical protein
LDCGGKRSATPLSHGRESHEQTLMVVRPKAVSPLAPWDNRAFFSCAMHCYE